MFVFRCQRQSTVLPQARRVRAASCLAPSRNNAHQHSAHRPGHSQKVPPSSGCCRLVGLHLALSLSKSSACLPLSRSQSPAAITERSSVVFTARCQVCSVVTAQRSAPTTRMSSRNKRRLHHDPLASDPEDLDYGAASSPKPQTRRSRTSKAPSRKPQKRQRRAYADTDDEIVEDEDEMSEGSFGSDTADEPEEEIEVNPRTGRGVRSAAKRNIKYEEPSDEDIEDAAQEEEARGATEHIARNKRARPSLIITLKLPPLKLGSPAGNMTIRQGTRSTRRGTTPEVTGTRRSSRLSHDDQEPMLALTDSGRHTQVVRPGTRSPEPQPTRQTRGGKGPKKNPSVIMEASQEISDPSRGEAAGEAKYDTGAEDAPGEEDNRAQVPSSDAGTPAGSETQADPQPSEDTRMGEAIVQESVHEDEDDDDDDIPITRSARNLRVRCSSVPYALIVRVDNQLVACSGHHGSPSYEKLTETPKERHRREQRF